MSTFLGTNHLQLELHRVCHSAFCETNHLIVGSAAVEDKPPGSSRVIDLIIFAAVVRLESTELEAFCSE